MSIYVRDDPEDVKRPEDIDWKTAPESVNREIYYVCALCLKRLQPSEIYRLHPVQYEWERDTKFRTKAVILHKNCVFGD